MRIITPDWPIDGKDPDLGCKLQWRNNRTCSIFKPPLTQRDDVRRAYIRLGPMQAKLNKYKVTHIFKLIIYVVLA